MGPAHPDPRCPDCRGGGTVPFDLDSDNICQQRPCTRCCAREYDATCPYRGTVISLTLGRPCPACHAGLLDDHLPVGDAYTWEGIARRLYAALQDIEEVASMYVADDAARAALVSHALRGMDAVPRAYRRTVPGDCGHGQQERDQCPECRIADGRPA